MLRGVVAGATPGVFMAFAYLVTIRVPDAVVGSPQVAAGWRRGYLALAWLALLWAAGNATYVYLIVGGQRTFRVEAAAYILVVVLLPLFWPHNASRDAREALTTRDNWVLVTGAVVLGWRQCFPM